MKKFIIFCLMAFMVCLSANAQNTSNEELNNKIAELVNCNYSVDDISKRVEATYDIVYETGMDSQTMYKHLMTLLYVNKDVSINAVDNMYQIRVKVDKDFWYDIFLKDGRLKIYGKLYSYDVYDNLVFKQSLGELYIHHIYKQHIVDCIVRIVNGYSHLFDF